MNTLLWRIKSGLKKEAPGGSEYTKHVMNMLKLDDSKEIKILNLACGKGDETLTLARELNCHITALDADEPSLQNLMLMAEKECLDSKITIVFEDITSMTLKEKKYDVIWVEGAMHLIGFEYGIKEFRKYLRIGGILVIGDYVYNDDTFSKEVGDFFRDFYYDMNALKKEKFLIEYNNFKLIDTYVVDEEAWNAYHDELSSQIETLKLENIKNPIYCEYLNNRLKEVELRKKYSSEYSYVFFIARKESKIKILNKK